MANNTIRIRPQNYVPYTLVPNFFIDECLAKINGEFIKVYLVLLRFLSVGHYDFDMGQIADILYMTESDVLRALNYFQHEQLMTLTFENNRLVEIYLNNYGKTPTDPVNRSIYKQDQGTQSTYANEAPPVQQPLMSHKERSLYDNDHPSYNNERPTYESEVSAYEQERPYSNNPIDTHLNKTNLMNDDYSQGRQKDFREESLTDAKDYDEYQETENHRIQDISKSVNQAKNADHLKVVTSRPEYTAKEVNVFAQEDAYTELFYITQKYLAKTLSSADLQTLISFHDWLGLPFEVIEHLIEYCAENDHRNIRYIETVAIDWADAGINTIEKAKARTETFKRSYFKILKAYGIIDRSPLPNQIKLMDRWLNDLNMSMDVIIEACERTINQINKAEMRYTDTILENWSKLGIRQVTDIERLDAPKRRDERPSPERYNGQGNRSNKETKQNSFNNYDQRSYDYENLEKRALEMRMKDFNGKRYSS